MELNEKIKNIQCLICDVDGVLSDGLLYIDNSGREVKSFHVHDGVGLKLLMAAGLTVAVITTSVSEIIDHRMKQLGIVHYFKAPIDKRESFYQLRKQLNLQNEQFAYIGDDLPDIPLMQQVGLGVAVANAQALVKESADWITEKNGGAGAVREVCDLILHAQDKTAWALEKYLAS